MPRSSARPSSVPRDNRAALEASAAAANEDLLAAFEQRGGGVARLSSLPWRSGIRARVREARPARPGNELDRRFGVRRHGTYLLRHTAQIRAWLVCGRLLAP